MDYRENQLRDEAWNFVSLLRFSCSDVHNAIWTYGSEGRFCLFPLLWRHLLFFWGIESPSCYIIIWVIIIHSFYLIFLPFFFPPEHSLLREKLGSRKPCRIIIKVSHHSVSNLSELMLSDNISLFNYILHSSCSSSIYDSEWYLLLLHFKRPKWFGTIRVLI